MGTTTEPDRIWITRNGVYSKVCRSRPPGEACTEYVKVREIAAGQPKVVEAEQPPAKRQKPLTQRDAKPALNRAAKPLVRKAPDKKGR